MRQLVRAGGIEEGEEGLSSDPLAEHWNCGYTGCSSQRKALETVEGVM